MGVQSVHTGEVITKLMKKKQSYRNYDIKEIWLDAHIIVLNICVQNIKIEIFQPIRFEVEPNRNIQKWEKEYLETTICIIDSIMEASNLGIIC